MNQTQLVVPENIAQEAEFEIWRSIRDETRGRLTRSISVGFLYLLAALAVGAYLMLTLAEVGRDTVIFSYWELERLEVAWVTEIAWGYGAMALVAIIGYVLTLLLIRDLLPPSFSRIVSAIPWIGSTIRIVAMGDFCQSIYESVLLRQTYSDALARAATAVRNPDLRQWSRHSSKRIDSGHSLASVLHSSPIRDQPLSAVTAFVAQELSIDESVRVWHHATAECHSLARSRLHRTTQVISVTCLLVCVSIAAFAMFLSGMLTASFLQGMS